MSSPEFSSADEISMCVNRAAGLCSDCGVIFDGCGIVNRKNSEALRVSSLEVDRLAFSLGAVIAKRPKIREETRRLELKAFTDQLTHALNRSGGEDWASQYWGLGHGPILVAATDLRGFKLPNDVYGHPRGDELLVDAAKYYNQMLIDTATPLEQDLIDRRHDTITPFSPSRALVRPGGDEFWGLVHLNNGTADEINDQVDQVAERLSSHKMIVNDPAGLRDPIEVTTRFGLHIVNQSSGKSYQQAVKIAEAALTEVGKTEKNRRGHN